MKVVLSEYSAGFSDYSWILCNELIKYVDELTYLTEQKNDYISCIDSSVIIHPLFQSFKADGRHRKGSFFWFYDRGVTAIKNCRMRNKFICNYPPDIILIQATLSTFECLFLKEIKKYTKVALIVHDVIVPTSSLSWSKKSLKKTYDTADLLIVHSETNKKQMMEMFDIEEEKLTVIPHGVRSSFHRLDKAGCRKQLGIEEGDRVFLFYGSLRESKGLDVLLEAMRGIDGVLIIAGAPFYGESFDRYKTIIDRYKLRTVEFIEYTDDAFRDVLFQASDYMVLPYKEFYSQSGVFMQSIQFHLPIIATDVSSFREYIERYDIGYICRPDDAADLHRVLNEAWKNKRSYEDQMKKAVFDNCWEITSKIYFDVLEGFIQAAER